MSDVKYGTLLVEVTGNHRSGTAKASGKPYCMFEAYVLLPGIQYPQRADFYAEMPNQVPQTGVYECDIIPELRQGRLEFNCDPRQGRRKNIASLAVPPKVNV